MPRTGFLTYIQGESQLDGLLLAVEGASNPLTAATTYLVNNGFVNNQRIRVTGRNAKLGNVPVYYMTGVQPAAEAIAIGTGAIAVGNALKGLPSSAKRSTRKARETGTKGSASKGLSARKGGSKKSTKKNKPAAKKAGRANKTGRKSR